MALKKRFWEAAQNRLGIVCFFCVLDAVTTVATPLYLYLQALSQVYPLIAKNLKSCDMLSRNRFCLLDRKILTKSPDHLFDRNFFDSMLHTITFQASVQSFLI